MASSSSTCNIGVCKEDLKGRKSSNLERHIQRHHPDQFSTIAADKVKFLQAKADTRANEALDGSRRRPEKRKSPFLSVCMDEKRLKLGLCELLTTAGLPLSVMEQKGLRLIIDPILEAINRNRGEEAKVTINRQNIKKELSQEAGVIRQQIRDEVKGKMVCLKADTATRLSRQLLGVNIQYVHHGRLMLRNLCVKELYKSHTAEHLQEEIQDTLAEFHISPRMIYTGTTDNAPNMTKAVTLLAQGCEPLELQDCQCLHDLAIAPDEDQDGDAPTEKMSDLDDDLAGSEDTEDSVTDAGTTDTEDEEVSQTLTPPVTPTSNLTLSGTCRECELVKNLLSHLGVHSVRCAAHTLQLAIADALKSKNELEALTKKARQLSKSLRTPTRSAILKRMGKKKPTLDVVTRWHSTYDMISSLLDIKDTIKIILENEKSQKTSGKRLGKGKNSAKKKRHEKSENLTDQEWEVLGDFCASLKPSKLATKTLQCEQLTVGDFYSTWLKCKLATEKILTPLAKDLVAAMNRREEILLSTPAFSAALFMDPRFRVLLPEERKSEALIHLQALWERLKVLDAEQGHSDVIDIARASPCSSDQEPEDGVEGSADSDFEQLLRKSEEESSGRPKQDANIVQLLKKMAKEPRLNKKSSVLEYWDSRRNTDPELCRLAETALAVPMTQVSVERIFSELRQVLSILRYNLSAEVLNNILLSRCNKQLSRTESPK